MAQDITLIPTTSPLLDLQIGSNGDFITSESSQQEVDIILNVFQGNLFQFPLCGVGIIKMLAGNTSAIQIETIIKNQMITDGFTVESINVDKSNLDNVTVNVQAFRP